MFYRFFAFRLSIFTASTLCASIALTQGAGFAMAYEPSSSPTIEIHFEVLDKFAPKPALQQTSPKADAENFDKKNQPTKHAHKKKQVKEPFKDKPVAAEPIFHSAPSQLPSPVTVAPKPEELPKTKAPTAPKVIEPAPAKVEPEPKAVVVPTPPPVPVVEKTAEKTPAAPAALPTPQAVMDKLPPYLPEAKLDSDRGKPAFSINFLSTETAVPLSSEDELKKLIARMNVGNEHATLVAYASGAGDKATTARRVSLSRALAVRAFLIEHELDKSRIIVQAEGNKNVSGEPDRVDIFLDNGKVKK